jgi:Golgi SNAP receptor complex protein 1
VRKCETQRSIDLRIEADGAGSNPLIRIRNPVRNFEPPSKGSLRRIGVTGGRSLCVLFVAQNLKPGEVFLKVSNQIREVLLEVGGAAGPEMALGAGWTPHAAGSVGWDDLRKQARRLESELDVKLASFRRGQIDPTVEGQRDGNEAEIVRLLQHLNDVNSQMQNWVSGAGSDVLSHTLARHQNILHELSQEFARIRVSTKAQREHAELLQYFGGNDESKSFLDDRGSGVNSLLREQATINRSTAQLDSVIGHAQEAYTALKYQRTTFGTITSKIGTLGSRIPSVNKVLTAIRRRKSRDSLIVGAVTSLCIILLLLYWLAK